MRWRSASLLALTGCSKLLGIPGGGELTDGGGDDGPLPIANCEDMPLTCTVLATDRAIAQESERIVLEGTFGNEVTVTFPDGLIQVVPGGDIGPHRVVVEVPQGATGGVLEVSTAGRVVGRVPFRGTSYRVGPTHFQIEYPQTSGARRSPRLSTPRAGAAPIVLRDRLHVIGGRGALGSGVLASVESAVINADGTLSRFVPGINLGTPRANHTATLVGNFVHVIGGNGAASALASVESSPLGMGSDLGTFMAGPSLTTPRAGHRSVVIGNHLYVIGGSGMDGTALATVERSIINPDGSLGPFALVDGVTLDTARTSHAAVVVRDQLYVLGGTTGNATSVPLASVESATINPDGTLQAFAPAGMMLMPRAGHGAQAMADKLVVFGGFTSATSVEQGVEQANVSPDGTLGPFGGVMSRTQIGRADVAHAIVGNFLYAIGGVTFSAGAQTTLASVEHTSLVQASMLDAFVDTGQLVFASGSEHLNFSVAALGPNVYLIGGERGTSPRASTDRSPITPGGGIGGFVADLGMSSPRTRHAQAIADDVMLLGGSATGAAGISNIDAAPLALAGTPVAFSISSRTLDLNRMDHTAAIVDNSLFVFGGTADATVAAHQSSARAALQDGGGLMTAFTTGVSLQAQRRQHCSVVIGDSIYHIGGNTGGTTPVALASIERTVFNRTDGVLSPGTNEGSLNTNLGSVTCAVIGKFLYVVGNNQGSGTPGRAVERAEIEPLTLELKLPFAPVSGTLLATPRFEAETLELSNGLFVLGGNNGTGTTLGSIERAGLR